MGLEGFVIPTFMQVIFILLMAEAVTGILTNGFILLVNLQDRINGQSLNSCDQIVFALSISNTAFSFVITATFICSTFFSFIYLMDWAFYTSYFLMTYTIFSSSWLTSWLCLFFCLKIINFKNGVLAWLKMKIDTVVPWLILTSQVITFISSIPVFWTFTPQFAENSTLALVHNQTSVITGYKLNASYSSFSLITNCCFPFIIVIATTCRIIGSLFMHVRHIKQNMGEFGSPNLKAHQSAAYTMLSLLILYLIFYIVELLIGVFSMESPWYWVCFVVIFSFSTVQSILLIMGNAKLKQASLKILNSCRSKD